MFLLSLPRSPLVDTSKQFQPVLSFSLQFSMKWPILKRERQSIYLSIYLISLSLSLYLSVCLSVALQPFVAPWPLFQFLDLFTQSVGLLGWGFSPLQGRYLHTEQHKQNKGTETSMPWVGFELTIPAFERVKTVHASDRVAIVIGYKRTSVHHTRNVFVYNKIWNSSFM
jgi:hypothetical protein